MKRSKMEAIREALLTAKEALRPIQGHVPRGMDIYGAQAFVGDFTQAFDSLTELIYQCDRMDPMSSVNIDVNNPAALKGWYQQNQRGIPERELLSILHRAKDPRSVIELARADSWVVLAVDGRRIENLETWAANTHVPLRDPEIPKPTQPDDETTQPEA